MDILKFHVKKHLDAQAAAEAAQEKKSSKKSLKREKDQTGSNRPTNAAIDAVLQRYLRYCKDQQSINFIIWRKLGYANEARSQEDHRTIKYALLLQQRNHIPLRGDKGIITDPSQLGQEVTHLIPILKPESKRRLDEIEIEA